MHKPTFEKYAHFQAEDFLQDEYFLYWVLSDIKEVDAFWNTFILIYPHQKERVEEAQRLAGSIRYKSYRLSLEKQDTILEQVYEGSKRESGYSTFYQKRYMAVAASISLLLISALFWLLYPSYETYETGYQETRTVQLADGSEVTLNANTKIRVVIDNEKNQPRQLWLEGEAYFNIAHLNDEIVAGLPDLKKFVVHTDNFDIEVLGTVFNASSRASKNEVLLKEGSVKVASEKIATSQILEPGDQLALSEEDQAFQIKKLEKPVEPAWRENYFIFQNTPLHEVAQEIENYYGLDVELTDSSLAYKIFTAKVSRNDLSLLLKAIESTFEVKITQDGDEITIQNSN